MAGFLQHATIQAPPPPPARSRARAIRAQQHAPLVALAQALVCTLLQTQPRPPIRTATRPTPRSARAAHGHSARSAPLRARALKHTPTHSTPPLHVRARSSLVHPRAGRESIRRHAMMGCCRAHQAACLPRPAAAAAAAGHDASHMDGAPGRRRAPHVSILRDAARSLGRVPRRRRRRAERAASHSGRWRARGGCAPRRVVAPLSAS